MQFMILLALFLVILCVCGFFFFFFLLSFIVHCNSALGPRFCANKIISYHIISYHIISYHIISYHISYHIVSYMILRVPTNVVPSDDVLKKDLTLKYSKCHNCIQPPLNLWTPQHGHKKLGRPPTTYVDVLVKDTGPTKEELETTTKDRSIWRAIIGVRPRST